MLRTSLLATTLLLAACGMDPVAPAREEALVVSAPQAPPPGPPREGVRERVPGPGLQQLRPIDTSVRVHSLAAPDGTRVRYVLGIMGCGLSVVSRGLATVQGGAFEVPFEEGSLESASLFFLIEPEGAGACDPQTSQVFEVPVSLPGSLDLSSLPEQSYAGCWLFDAAE